MAHREIPPDRDDAAELLQRSMNAYAWEWADPHSVAVSITRLRADPQAKKPLVEVRCTACGAARDVSLDDVTDLHQVVAAAKAAAMQLGEEVPKCLLTST
jgi:hypothetical protein